MNLNRELILLQKKKIISEVVQELRQFEGIIDGVYLIGSSAYEQYIPSWSDLDFAIFFNTRSEVHINKINKLITSVNQQYKGRIAGNGDSVIDIGFIFKSGESNILHSEYTHYDNASIVRILYETLHYGRLLLGEEQSTWISETLMSVPLINIKKAFVHSTIERILLYHDIQEIKQKGILSRATTIDTYAPHKKYKVIPMLYISICRALLFVKNDLFVTKKDAFRRYAEHYNDYISDFKLAFELRNDWRPEEQLIALDNLSRSLPGVISWFFDVISPSIYDGMYYLRGRKVWHYRGTEAERIKLFLESMNRKELLDSIDQYMSLDQGYEITFAQTDTEIVGVAGYKFISDNKELMISFLATTEVSVKQLLLNYVHRRSTEKNTKCIIPTDFTQKGKEFIL